MTLKGVEKLIGVSSIYDNLVYDIDGNKYHYITIGTQTWMVENLMTTHYRDGTAINRGATGSYWPNLDYGNYAYPPNITNDAEETLENIISNKLGFVYQHSCIRSAHGLTPAGWHVPSDDEFKILEMYLGMSQEEADVDGFRGTHNEGNKLKEIGNSHWSTSDGTDTVGFKAVGSGHRRANNIMAGRNTSTSFWTTTADKSTSPYLYFDRSLYSSGDDGSKIGRHRTAASQGSSIRCIKD